VPRLPFEFNAATPLLGNARPVGPSLMRSHLADPLRRARECAHSSDDVPRGHSVKPLDDPCKGARHVGLGGGIRASSPDFLAQKGTPRLLWLAARRRDAGVNRPTTAIRRKAGPDLGVLTQVLLISMRSMPRSKAHSVSRLSAAVAMPRPPRQNHTLPT